ncbi:MAG: nicotinate phosphoribosyltransferase [Oscillospiraceae bacterium]|nr:nicotinate phosphoribosyltransferase [Oscillospiraceae bacterium]
MNNVNYTMLFDYYELTMGNGYFEKGLMDRVCYFDLFYRRVPGDGGYVIAAGLEQAIDYIKNLHFDDKDIEYLRSKKQFSEDFLEYLKDFRFTGDVWAVPEGTVVFPNEPIMTIRAPAIQAQLLETFLLLTINHQSLIATKANRIVRAAEGRVIAEFGSRRAHGPDAAVLGARAAYIGGAAATACALTDEEFGVPATGTMAHSWVQMFDTEYEAFKAYCEVYPDNATLLVDTYNVLKSGVPNAIKAFDEVLKPLGKRPKGIRIDSGDITYLSQKARKMLDDAGYPDCKITASNSLDEYLIRDMLLQGAKIDSFGVGERLITSKPSSVLDGVYKLVAFEDENGNVIPKIKISENVQKITTPHFKKLYRLYDNDNGKAIADYLCVHDESVNDMEPLEIFDPDYTWKRRTLENYTARELLVPIFKNGECVYNMPSLSESRNHCIREITTMWDSVLRFENPHVHYVDLSQKLWDIKQELLNEHSHHFSK